MNRQFYRIYNSVPHAEGGGRLTWLAIIFGLALLLVVAAFGWRWGGGNWDRHFAVAESLLAICGLIGGGAWYFLSKPDAPKLKLEQSAISMPSAAEKVILLSELTLTNVGGRSLRLKDQPYKIYVQQITPVTSGVAAEFNPNNSTSSPRRMISGDTWTYLAMTEGHISSDLEAGESENLYHRVILPCQDGLSVYVTTWVEKPQDGISTIRGESRLSWIKQTFADLSKECSTSKGGIK